MRVLCVSDLHGVLPQLPEADVLVIAGDICPTKYKGFDQYRQSAWLYSTFRPWINSHNFDQVFLVFGNHDQIGEHPELIPELPPNVNILTDKGDIYRGLYFHGTPWQRRFCDWSFNAEEEQLAAIYEQISPQVDVLISHGPPWGFGDQVRKGSEHLGSPSLTGRLKVIEPSLTVFGHIHGGNGVYSFGDRGCMNLINAALMTENYELRQCAYVATFKGRHVINIESHRYVVPSSIA